MIDDLSHKIVGLNAAITPWGLGYKHINWVFGSMVRAGYVSSYLKYFKKKQGLL